MAESGPASQYPPPPEDEIDLADLAAVLYRRRWLIVGGTVLVTLLALIYTLLSPERYEVKSFLSVGKVEGEPIEDPKTVSSLMSSYAQTLAEKRNSGDQKLGFSAEQDLQIDPQGGGIIRLSLSQAPKRETTTEFLNQVSQYVIDQHENDIRRQEKSLKQEIQSLKAEIAELENRKEELNTRIEKATGGPDGGGTPDDISVSVLNNLLQGVRADLESRQLELSNKEDQLAALRPTEVMLEPTYSENPVQPNLRLNVALGFVLGGFLSVFAAFLWEFWVNNRDRIRGG